MVPGFEHPFKDFGVHEIAVESQRWKGIQDLDVTGCKEKEWHQ